MNLGEIYRQLLQHWYRVEGVLYPKLRSKIKKTLADPDATEATYADLIQEVNKSGGPTIGEPFGDQTEEWPETKSPAYWLGDGRVQVGDDLLSLEPQMADVLQALVELKTATTPDLKRRSGRDEPGRILKKIVIKFPALKPFILFPGGRGKGGYSTTIIKKADGS